MWGKPSSHTMAFPLIHCVHSNTYLGRPPEQFISEIYCNVSNIKINLLPMGA